HAQQGDLLSVELFELAHRSRIVVEAAVLELDAELVQEVDHRGRFERLFRPVQDCLRFAHRLSNDTVGAFHRLSQSIVPIRCIDAADEVWVPPTPLILTLSMCRSMPLTLTLSPKGERGS